MKIKYNLEQTEVIGNELHITGWAAMPGTENIADFYVTDKHRKEIEARIARIPRPDVSEALYGEPNEVNYGFSVVFPYEKNNSYQFVIDFKEKRKYIRLNNLTINIEQKRQLADKVIMYAGNFVNLDTRSFPIPYRFFKTKTEKDAEKEVDKTVLQAKDAPVFSIVIPLYNTPENYLDELLQSIKEQIYGKYEVCLADGSDSNKLEQFLVPYMSEDPRIRYTYLNKNGGISGNTNAAMKMALGDFIVLCDHDDLLSKYALYELAKAVLDNPECDCIYTDEDKVDETSRTFFDPHFKPDFNIDLLCSVNYICHLYAVRRSLAEETGGFDCAYDGAQDYDFIFRTTEKARKVVHVPKVLYHWRTHLSSTSMNPESKMYAFDAGKRAIRAHYERTWPEIKIESIENGVSLGVYHTIFDVEEELISVIIPNKDHTDDLDKAIRSLFNESTYRNFEIIVIENNSTEKETLDYYERIQKEYPQVHVIYYEGVFNYSRINNFGVKAAKGKYLLFMNNDVELLEKDSLKELVGYVQRKDVGAAGCLLLYEDNTIQHAGVIVGIGGVADHAFKGYRRNEMTYFSRAHVAQDLSAVTAAVMMMRRDVFDEVNGFDEDFAVAFNDIDLCLRIRKTGRLIVYNPYACFHHYESKSRGQEDTEEKQKRFQSEIARFIGLYEEDLRKGDPMYNPNLSISRNDFKVRNPYFDKIGRPYYYGKVLDSLKDMNK